MALHLAEDGQAVLAGQSQVEDEDVGFLRLHGGQAVLPGATARENREAGVLEQSRDPIEDDRMGIGDDDDDGANRLVDDVDGRGRGSACWHSLAHLVPSSIRTLWGKGS